MIIFDGNNLLHKHPQFKKGFKENPSGAQLLLIDKIRSHHNSKEKIIIVFDGFSEIKSSNVIFAGAKSADDVIRSMIEQYYSKEQITIVSSDYGITNLAKVCSCSVIKSEDYWKESESKKSSGNENINQNLRTDDEKPGGMSKKDFDEFKKYFT